MKSPGLIATVAFSICGFVVFGSNSVLSAQQTRPTNINIQLPTVGFFNVRTVVSVPDAGVMSLGGASRSASGSSVRRTGPAWVRPFRNRGLGSRNSASNAAVQARVIINSEIEEGVMAEAAARRLAREIVDPNGSPAVQHQADFLTRHMGR